MQRYLTSPRRKVWRAVKAHALLSKWFHFEMKSHQHDCHDTLLHHVFSFFLFCFQNEPLISPCSRGEINCMFCILNFRPCTAQVRLQLWFPNVYSFLFYFSTQGNVMLSDTWRVTCVFTLWHVFRNSESVFKRAVLPLKWLLKCDKHAVNIHHLVFHSINS